MEATDAVALGGFTNRDISVPDEGNAVIAEAEAGITIPPLAATGRVATAAAGEGPNARSLHSHSPLGLGNDSTSLVDQLRQHASANLASVAIETGNALGEGKEFRGGSDQETVRFVDLFEPAHLEKGDREERRPPILKPHPTYISKDAASTVSGADMPRAGSE